MLPHIPLLRLIALTLIVLPSWFLLLAPSVHAEHDNTWHPPPGPGSGHVNIYLHFFWEDTFPDNLPSSPRINLTGAIGSNGETRVSGAVQIIDGETKLTLVPVRGASTSSCAIGSGGLLTIEATMRNVRTGERIPLTIRPAEPVTTTGTVLAVIDTGGHVYDGTIDVRIRDA